MGLKKVSQSENFLKCWQKAAFLFPNTHPNEDMNQIEIKNGLATLYEFFSFAISNLFPKNQQDF